MRYIAEQVFDLLYPKCCIVCQRPLVQQEELVCLRCMAEIQPTDYHLYANNPVAQKFYNKLPVEYAIACFPFVKHGKVQQLLHALKYKGHSNLSYIIGKWYANKIISEAAPPKFDAIIPVPLHPKKLQKRGYNQSEGFANGLAEVFQTESMPYALQRNKATETQTKKTRLARWENVNGIFQLSPSANVKDLHVLLVDDVITTGATLEACAQACMQSKAKAVSIAAIAYA